MLSGVCSSFLVRYVAIEMTAIIVFFVMLLFCLVMVIGMLNLFPSVRTSSRSVAERGRGILNLFPSVRKSGRSVAERGGGILNLFPSVRTSSRSVAERGGGILNLFPSVRTSSRNVAERGGWSGRTMAAGGTTGWGGGGVANASSSLRVLEPAVAACTLTGWRGGGGGTGWNHCVRILSKRYILN